jgi:nitrogen regulatory protein PII
LRGYASITVLDAEAAMIGQETRDVERKTTAILKILSESEQPAGSRVISQLLEGQGIYLGERAVRYHLKIMDERGLTRSLGHKDGRTITVAGLNELRNSLVTDKLGFIRCRGRQKGIALQWRAGEYRVDFLPKVKLEIIVSDGECRAATDIICSAARTGREGDGMIFVLPAEEAIRVRTCSCGETCVTCR